MCAILKHLRRAGVKPPQDYNRSDAPATTRRSHAGTELAAILAEKAVARAAGDSRPRRHRTVIRVVSPGCMRECPVQAFGAAPFAPHRARRAAQSADAFQPASPLVSSWVAADRRAAWLRSRRPRNP